MFPQQEVWMLPFRCSVLFAVLAGPAFAQESPSVPAEATDGSESTLTEAVADPVADKVDALLARIDALEQQAAAPPVAAPVAAPAAPAPSTGSGAAEQRLLVNGFGHWSFGKTMDENDYGVATEQGSYDDVSVLLAFTAKPSDKLTLRLQPFVGTVDDGFRADVIVAHGDWAFGDGAHLVVGASRHPFGLYADIIDVGILRPLPFLPTGLYGSTVVAEHYYGAGLNGQTHTSSGWGLVYDIYYGQIPLQAESAIEELLESDEDDTGTGTGAASEESEESEGTRGLVHAVGTRINVPTSIDGLKFGASYFRGLEGEEEDGEIEFVKQWALGGHVEALLGSAIVRAEYAHHVETGVIESDMAYAEVAYRLNMGLQPALRYERYKSNPLVDYDGPKSLLKHSDAVLGLAYFFQSEFAIKASVHSVRGNAFVQPDDLLGEISTGQILEKDTVAVFAGMDYAF